MTPSGCARNCVAGHSVGEFAAAHVAGVLSLADAARLIASARAAHAGIAVRRSHAGGPGLGSRDRTAASRPGLADAGQQIAVAAINGPASIVLSGAQDAVERIAAEAARLGRKTRRLKVSHAFHSPLMEPALPGLRAVADSVTPQPPGQLKFVSTVTGQLATAAELSQPDYWTEHARRPVRFASALDALLAAGTKICLEVGPGNGVTAMGKAALAGTGGARMTFLASMHGRDEVEALSTAVAALQVRGSQLRWRTLFGDQARRADLPTYPFQRQRYWLDSRPADQPRQEPPEPPEPSERPKPPESPATTAADAHALVTAAVKLVIGHDGPGPVDLTRPFTDLGFDSAMTVELVARLSAALGRELQPSLLYRLPDPRRADRAPRPSRPTRSTRHRPRPRPAQDEPIAVIAMGCRYPGGVRSPEDLWDLVDEGRDAISEFPVNRGWDLIDLYDPEPGKAGRTYTRLGGFLHDADRVRRRVLRHQPP